MVVCMSRRICVDLYRELVRLRPDWHDHDDSRGRPEGGDDRLRVRPPGLAAARQATRLAARRWRRGSATPPIR